MPLCLQSRRSSIFMRLARQNCPPVRSDRICRLIEGVDDCPAPLSESAIKDELNDPWALNILRQHVFPTNVDAIVQSIQQAQPQLAQGQKNYMVGEGSQIPLTVAPREADRKLRYVLTWGRKEDGGQAEILLSARAAVPSPFLQVISWDPRKNRYNFYEYNVAWSAWCWAGDSSYARDARSSGQGCFDCHHNGVVIMKELKLPWNNWHSQLVTIDPEKVPQAIAAQPLFNRLSGAEQLESSVKGGVQRYYTTWLQSLLQKQPDGSTLVKGVPEMLQHIITNTTINLASTQIKPSQDASADITGLPNDFFLNDSLRDSSLGLEFTFPELVLKRNAYDSYLRAHDFRLVNDAPPYVQPGSTFFAFLVPVPAFEDTLVTKQLLSLRVVSPKFVASILLVDFPNPVFSPVRESLWKYATQLPTGRLLGGQSDVPERFAALVAKAAQGQPACNLALLDRCTAEQQFLFFWGLPDEQWQQEGKRRIEKYLAAVHQRLTTGQGLDDLMRLSASRQVQFAQRPRINNLCEFSLLIPQSDLPPKPLLRMRPDGITEPLPPLFP